MQIEFKAVQKCTNLLDLDKTLPKAYFLANIGFDAAENELSKFTILHLLIPGILEYTRNI